MKKLVLSLLALVVLVALGLSFYTLGDRDTSDKADIDKVAKEAKKEAKKEPQEDPGLRPTPGTYVYAGSGGDEVDVLGGSKHEYPEEAPLVVKLGKGCEWTWELTYVEQHKEQHEWCTDKTGVQTLGFHQQIEFFRSTDKTDLECGKDSYRVKAGARPGATWKYSCKDDKRELNYTVTFVGTEQLMIGGSKVKAFHVKLKDEVSGASEGTDTLEFWYAASGLPLKWKTLTDVQTESVLGDTAYDEKTEYELTSTKPR